MIKLTEKYYIGVCPKQLNTEKVYLFLGNEHIRYFKYEPKNKGWRQTDLNPLNKKFVARGNPDSNHDLATRINNVLNSNLRNFLFNEVFEIDFKNLDKFLLIKKLTR